MNMDPEKMRSAAETTYYVLYHYKNKEYVHAKMKQNGSMPQEADKCCMCKYTDKMPDGIKEHVALMAGTALIPKETYGS